MTDDYKERVIKWLTGNYEIEQSSTDPLIGDIEQTTTTINDYFDEIIGYIQGKDGKGNDLNLGFIYGNKNSKGVIVIVDSNLEIIQVIEEYNTGTDFNKWLCLNIDNANGNIYGVDLQGNQQRFVLLNNFLVKPPAQQDYEVKLRNDYFLNYTDNTFTPKFVEKRQSDAFYVMTGTYSKTLSQQGTFIKPAVATYQINVGSTNELNLYLSSDTQTHDYKLKAYNIIWNDQSYSLKMSGFYFIPYDVLTYQIYYEEFSFNGTTINEIGSTYVRITYNPNYSGAIKDFDINSSFILTNTESYIAYIENQEAGYLKKFDYSDNIFQTLDDIFSSYGSVDAGSKVIKVKNQIFYYLWARETETDYSLRVGKINYSNGQIYLTTKQFDNLEVGSLLDSMTDILLNISNTYNLYTYNIIGSNSNIMLSVQQIFNELNYNYKDYQDISSLVPNSGILYSDDKIIFARNLYNKVINGNTTMASIEVPNMLLNDIDIDLQELWGQTNGVLVENTETIQKNIYEDLFINFYNTLTMQNQNTQNYIYNLIGATRLNNSISNLKDYTNAKIAKIRINYSDNTTFIKNLDPATQISQFVYQFEFNVYVPLTKGIISIELISDDELTSYQTIDTTSLVLGKSYKITQNVEIGE